MSAPIPKPVKGTRKAEQWARTERNAKARIAAKAIPQPHRSSLRKVGERGAGQNAWNLQRKREWLDRYGKLECCVTGAIQLEVTRGMDSLVVVGHILSRAERPDLAQDISNVAPISSEINDRMRPGSARYSAPVHAWAVKAMVAWVARDRKMR